MIEATVYQRSIAENPITSWLTKNIALLAAMELSVYSKIQPSQVHRFELALFQVLKNLCL